MPTRHASFAEFYPYYLSQHANLLCRRAHFIGSTSALGALAQYVVSMNGWWVLAALVSGYGGAWIGHFFYEKNRPASFARPLYSFMGDWVMYWQMLTGKLSW
ncbi:DUF962 domain-containing protein [Massilia sp. CCM 8733]|uniref:DUF962 domain-containing protein n=1 Tax=Massilia mucilaginosa TaxID=2609282 RepID=A0ABX0NS43_9BURK|nr:DUF962 domain-containing protein [Massilia mucilaginosa]NHZ89677.1 DUF962 domain-containing protein [Massilia mucilaginosa]